MKYQGLPIYPGAVFGEVLLYRPFSAAEVTIPPALDISEESRCQAFLDGRSRAVAELQTRIEGLDEAQCEQEGILQAHIELLSDPAIEDLVFQKLASGEGLFDALTAAFSFMNDILVCAESDFAQEKAADLRDVQRRLIRCICQECEQDLAALDRNIVLVCHELLPSDTATMDTRRITAIVTESGGVNSHIAVVARSLQLPTVLSVPGICAVVQDGETIFVDGAEGSVSCNYSPTEREELQERSELEQKRLTLLKTYSGKDGQTKDGVRIAIEANISDAEGLLHQDISHIDGVGLMRSELLYMQSQQLPDEDEQFRAYLKALQALNGKSLILRTLDIGGDKELPYLQLPVEDNPFLGLRALRLCLQEPDLFQSQLRAALRASAFGDLWLMFPMVSGLEDFRKAKDCVHAAMKSLDERGVAYNADIPLGIMIETPSIALMAGTAVKEVDFASIGTNDLCQYLLAVDRINSSVASYYQCHHPAMISLLVYVAKCFADAGKHLGVCGEMAGSEQSALLLVGAGIRHLSMSISRSYGVKCAIEQHTLAELEELTRLACSMTTAQEVDELFRI